MDACKVSMQESIDSEDVDQTERCLGDGLNGSRLLARMPISSGQRPRVLVDDAELIINGRQRSQIARGCRRNLGLGAINSACSWSGQRTGGLLHFGMIKLGVEAAVLGELNVGHGSRGVLAELLVRDAERVVDVRLIVAVVLVFLEARDELSLALGVLARHQVSHISQSVVGGHDRDGAVACASTSARLVHRRWLPRTVAAI